MGFYIRKSLSVGAFRFNLSGSGVGLSVGVKGFRIGTGPRGNYIHMGYGGLYYRSSLPGSSANRSAATSSSILPTEQPLQESATDSLAPIETGNVLDMQPSNGSDILDQINEKLNSYNLWPWILALGVLGACVLQFTSGLSYGLGVLIISLLLSALQARSDRLRKTVVIMYDLDDEVVDTFKSFADELEKFGEADRIWNVDTAGQTSDWKRNSGASKLITRTPARLGYGVPSVIKTNLDVPAIFGGRQNIYFFPDVALVFEGTQVGALSYDQLNVSWQNSTFIEEEAVPSDSQIVGHTWRFVNKSGGPDRRFNNNRQIPRVLYQEMHIKDSGIFHKMLQFSRIVEHRAFDENLSNIRSMICNFTQKNVDGHRKLENKNHEYVNIIDQYNSKNVNVLISIDRFDEYSGEAKRLASAKPKFWEHRLTIEILRVRMMPIINRWNELNGGRYKKTLAAVPVDQIVDWNQKRLDELQNFSSQVCSLVNEALVISWGPPGQPGDVELIREACEAMTDCAQQILQWEETVRFSPVPREFQAAQKMLRGVAGRILEQQANVYTELSKIFLQEKPTGNYNISFKVDLPEGWSTKFVAAMKKGMLSIS